MSGLLTGGDFEIGLLAIVQPCLEHNSMTGHISLGHWGQRACG